MKHDSTRTKRPAVSVSYTIRGHGVEITKSHQADHLSVATRRRNVRQLAVHHGYEISFMRSRDAYLVMEANRPYEPTIARPIVLDLDQLEIFFGWLDAS